MGPERRIVENVNGWLPLKAVLPMSRGGVRLLAGPLAPVAVFEVLAGPELFWDGADGALPPPWDGIFTDDLYSLVVGGRGWNLRTLGQWRALDENSGFLASSDVPWWRGRARASRSRGGGVPDTPGGGGLRSARAIR